MSDESQCRDEGMSELLRADRAAKRAASDARFPGLRESASPLALALAAAEQELRAAEALDDEQGRAAASARVDAIMDEARARQAAQDAAAVKAMREAGGARPAPLPVADMNDLIRAAAGR